MWAGLIQALGGRANMIAIFLMMLLAGTPTDQPAEQPALQCDIGPVTRQFGGSDWLVYGCADGHSVVVAAGTPNPATPFFFIITPDGSGGIELHGEGTGAQSATKPAYDALSIMSSSDLAALFKDCQRANDK
jgi:hypothetical protein